MVATGPVRGGTALPALVLVPGILNDADLWRDQCEGLSDVARVTVADITTQETIREAAQSILASVEGGFSLAGFSLGGYVAQEVLRVAPERVERLALLDTSFRPDTPERTAFRRMVNANAKLPGRFHGFGERLLATYLHEDARNDPVKAGRVRAMTERLGPDTLIRQNNFTRLDATEDLRRLHVPVLILCGDSDQITPLAEHEDLAALIPHARLVVIPGSGHLTPIEKPDLVTKALRDWLGDEVGRGECKRSSE